MEVNSLAQAIDWLSHGMREHGDEPADSRQTVTVCMSAELVDALRLGACAEEVTLAKTCVALVVTSRKYAGIETNFEVDAGGACSGALSADSTSDIPGLHVKLEEFFRSCRSDGYRIRSSPALGQETEPAHWAFELAIARDVSSCSSAVGACASDTTPRLIISSGPNPITIEFSTSRYSDVYMEWFARCFENVLSQTLTPRAGLRVGEVKLHGDIQMRTLIEAVGRTGALERAVGLPHRQVLAQLAIDSDAVVCGPESMSYTRLAELTAHIARGVLARVGDVNHAQRTVVVLSPAGLFAPAIMLGIFAARCIYVPLASDMPIDRLEHVLADCKPALILTDRAGCERLSALQLRADIGIATLETVLAETNHDLDLPGVEAADIAYVIYTSGSTGRPKGVPISHQALSRHMLGSIEFIDGPSADDKEPFKELSSGVLASSLAFDVSVWEMLLILGQGGTLHVLESEVTRDPAAMAHYLSAHNVSSACIRPALLQGVLDEFVTASLHFPLLHLFSGAEAVSHEVCAGFKRLNPRLRIIVGYGATESTIGGTLYDFDERRDYGYLPVGRPLSDYQFYVVDEADELCPLGVTGQILIGGPLISRGYLNKPEITARVFTQDPFQGLESARVYRTGDYGKWLPDGNLVFCGRRDDQVKINGVRVELAEIEVVFRNVSGASNALALVEGEGVQRRLLVYLEKPALNGRTAFQRAARMLLKTMLPSAVVAMDEFPKTQSMKIDRRRLPAPRREDMLAAESYEAASSGTEQLLCEIASEVFRLEAVGIDDDFGKLGVSSLLLVSFVNRVNQRAAARLPLALLTTHRTVRAMSEWIDNTASIVLQDDSANHLFEDAQ